jgi:hypothetical protein
MSELMNTQTNRSGMRWQLLATVSALALVGASAVDDQARASNDQDKPTVWIELGGQLERLGGGEEPFAPPFVNANLGNPYNIVSPLSAERRSRYSFGGEGKISFQPEGTDWVLSAGIRYGRSNRSKRLHQQTSTQKRLFFFYYGSSLLTQYGYPRQYIASTRFNDVQVKRKESHAILDFMVGKDVGLGLFSRNATSTLSAGVRYAQLNASAATVFHSVPVFYNYHVYTLKNIYSYHESYYANGELSRSFHGIGPSLSWTNSSPILGNPQAGEMAVDWGINAALLFGRQKVSGTQLITGRHFTGDEAVNNGTPTQHYIHPGPINRSRSVTVPNLGGFAGLSFNFPNAKVSMGYRADFFFGAMDGGVDGRKTFNRDFYGPFLKVGVGF